MDRLQKAEGMNENGMCMICVRRVNGSVRVWEETTEGRGRTGSGGGRAGREGGKERRKGRGGVSRFDLWSVIKGPAGEIDKLAR